MGYAFIIFGVLLIMSLVLVTAYNYGIVKDSQIAPFKAKNIYAERETDKAQTALTINYTCLASPGADLSWDRQDCRFSNGSSGNCDDYRYVTAHGTQQTSGPHTLYIGVRNNGSTVLNSTRATVLYNASLLYTDSSANLTLTNYILQGGDQIGGICQNPYFNTWLPLNYSCMQISNISIPTPNTPASGPILRLSVSAENGISTVAPTSPVNFNGIDNSDNHRYTFTWNDSYDADGIAYYRLYASDHPSSGCPFQIVSGDNGALMIDNIQSTSYIYYYDHDDDHDHLPRYHYFFVKAVDNLQNEGIQSRTIYCDDNDNQCRWDL